MTDAELDRLDALCNAASADPWYVGHNRDDCEGFSIAAPGSDTVCSIEEDQPGDFDDEAREVIAANFAFIAEARTALPALIAEVRRLRADQPLVVG